jgi:hypothetical protein
VAYWSCAGEVLAMGGPLPLGGGGGLGCRGLDLGAARRLHRFYLGEAPRQASASAGAYCRRCAGELAAAIEAALQWRRAAGNIMSIASVLPGGGD